MDIFFSNIFSRLSDNLFNEWRKNYKEKKEKRNVFQENKRKSFKGKKQRNYGMIIIMTI